MGEYLGFEPCTEGDYYFISYKHADAERLTGIATLLHKNGIPLWYDEDLNNSIPWKKQLGAKIKDSKGVILFVTKTIFNPSDSDDDQNESEHEIQDEFDLAVGFHNKPVYPVILEKIEQQDLSSDNQFLFWRDICKWNVKKVWDDDETTTLRKIFQLLDRPLPDKLITTLEEKEEKGTEAAYWACETLIRLEDLFQSNPRQIHLFSEMDKASRDRTYQVRFSEDSRDGRSISSSDIVQYLTFFESMYRAIKRGILAYEDIDDCFSDRFFKILHNTYVQENELYLVPDTYVNIFELYAKWKDYHVRKMASPRKIVSFLKNEIPDDYLDNKLYLQGVLEIEERNALEKRFMRVDLCRRSFGSEHTQFSLKRLFPEDLKEMLEFQGRLMENIDNEDLFVPSTRNEFIESMLIDFCYGLYDQDKLAAICLIVLNRDTVRNLYSECISELTDAPDKQLAYSDCITFDSIQVCGEYRGYGIQRFFLSLANDLCRRLHAKYILASVSPLNAHSKKNFELAGYEKLKTTRLNKGSYNNRERDIVCRRI